MIDAFFLFKMEKKKNPNNQSSIYFDVVSKSPTFPPLSTKPLISGKDPFIDLMLLLLNGTP